MATSLGKAGDRLFAFPRLPPSQWRSARTTNAVERLHKEFRHCIKTQTVLPSTETAAMLFWALMASGQITMRKIGGWQTLAEPFAATGAVDRAAWSRPSLSALETIRPGHFLATRDGTQTIAVTMDPARRLPVRGRRHAAVVEVKPRAPPTVLFWRTCRRGHIIPCAP